MKPIPLVLTQLMLPELRYQLDITPEQAQQARDKLHQWLFDRDSDAAWNNCLGCTDAHGKPDLPRTHYNALYLADRLFDGLVRKTNHHPALVERIQQWRFAAAAIFIQSPVQASVEHPLFKLIDSVLEHTLGWSPDMGRLAVPIAEQLDKIDIVVLSPLCLDEPQLQRVLDDWLGFVDASAKRQEKAVMRLLAAEQGRGRAEAAEAQARSLLYSKTAGLDLPEPVWLLFDRAVLPALKSYMLTADEANTAAEAVVNYCNQLAWCFSESALKQTSRLYEIAGEIEDNLISAFNSLGTKGMDQTLMTPVSNVLVSVVQGLETALVSAEDAGVNPATHQVKPLEKGGAEQISRALHSFYSFANGATDKRHQLIAHLREARQCLFVNMAGMKSEVLIDSDFLAELKTGNIKKRSPISFCQLIADMLRGLTKIVDTQMKARQKAREKAAEEARLLQQAQQQAKQQAAEEARLAEEALAQAKLEQKERERLQLEGELLRAIDAITLGGWIEISASGDKVKYKLAVRLSVTDKLIFVDRLGLNRKEFKRKQLAELIASGTVRILSESADFDDALSRVVGRLRVSR